MTTTALIVAAGQGERLGGGVPKQYREIGGKPMLRWAVEALIRHPAVNAARVVIGQGQDELAAGALHGLEVGTFIQGGEQRADSVRSGLAAIEGDAVLVHDRPFEAAGETADQAINPASSSMDSTQERKPLHVSL